MSNSARSTYETKGRPGKRGIELSDEDEGRVERGASDCRVEVELILYYGRCPLAVVVYAESDAETRDGGRVREREGVRELRGSRRVQEGGRLGSVAVFVAAFAREGSQ